MAILALAIQHGDVDVLRLLLSEDVLREARCFRCRGGHLVLTCERRALAEAERAAGGRLCAVTVEGQVDLFYPYKETGSCIKAHAKRKRAELLRFFVDEYGHALTAQSGEYIYVCAAGVAASQLQAVSQSFKALGASCSLVKKPAFHEGQYRWYDTTAPLAPDYQGFLAIRKPPVMLKGLFYYSPSAKVCFVPWRSADSAQGVLTRGGDAVRRGDLPEDTRLLTRGTLGKEPWTPDAGVLVIVGGVVKMAKPEAFAPSPSGAVFRLDEPPPSDLLETALAQALGDEHIFGERCAAASRVLAEACVAVDNKRTSHTTLLREFELVHRLFALRVAGHLDVLMTADQCVCAKIVYYHFHYSAPLALYKELASRVGGTLVWDKTISPDESVYRLEVPQWGV